jgi:anti-sigma regulatory factor (Ser/Thr protein kinase)
MTHQFKRDIASLGPIYDFISSALASSGAGEAVRYAVNLAVEELFTNLVKYNRSTTEDIPIIVEIRGSQICVTITDRADEPFDVTTAGNVDISRSISNRTRGGLGLHLVRKFVDHLSYEYSGGVSRISFTKYIG